MIAENGGQTEQQIPSEVCVYCLGTMVACSAALLCRNEFGQVFCAKTHTAHTPLLSSSPLYRSANRGKLKAVRTFPKTFGKTLPNCGAIAVN